MSLTVVIPALNEERRIAEVVAAVRQQAPQVPVIVIDDGSIDRTVERARSAGARVATSSMLGKGASMQDGLELVQTPWVLFLDGDLEGLRPDLVARMTAPLTEGRADLVKARFARSGGRVTELTAKPLLRVFFPELAHFAQPLGGIVAGAVDLLRSLTLEDDYGVDIGLMIDAHLRHARIEEVDIGDIAHDSQPLERLSLMAQQVSRAIMQRARHCGRFSYEQFQELEELERQARGTIERLAITLARAERVLLVSADGVLGERGYLQALARDSGREAALARALAPSADDAARHRAVAQVFQFVHQREFVRVARALPLRGDAVEALKRLRRAGWLVGVVSNGYFIGADIVRRRVFADFALAHLMVFRQEVATGQVRLNPTFTHSDGPVPEGIDKGNVARHLRDLTPRPGARVVAVGDTGEDRGLLQAADQGFVLAGAGSDDVAAPWPAVGSLSELAERLLAEGAGACRRG